ncbi:hypothetical protein KIH86_10255 [Paenibacillus sp. HN-1]|uniref:hypothetical protein n=1 Tax=Paenibacillus TaxID=44249 RepID=UPI001CA9C6F3|nr:MULTISPECIES: hypothetical protein [Paenibacillus]MBY9079971.1 hypothetical protein [Paenibacillus sp. CGMCC 1.18879]MBY9084613.1 hypothetical protein [Paenibacillus sinensis]
MYNSYVIVGRIIEIRNDRVLAEQGDMISSYHSRYYMLPDEEIWTEESSIEAEVPDATAEKSQVALHRLSEGRNKWNLGRLRLFPMKKSANRI